MKNYKFAISLCLLLSLSSCEEGDQGNTSFLDCSDKSLDQRELELKEKLDSVRRGYNFSVRLSTVSRNTTFSYDRGRYSDFTELESASTSKLVAGLVFADLIRLGFLSLDSHVHDYINFWPKSGHLSQIRLRHLLNFTSGLNTRNLCVDLAFGNFSDCVKKIRDTHFQVEVEPGKGFHYNPNHFQVAGLMAMNALGVGSWQAVFDNFKNQTGVFSTSKFDIPSQEKPRLAGGMHWKIGEYFDFLSTVVNQEVISTDLIQMFRNEALADLKKVKTISNSPPQRDLGEDWRYGYGFWFECRSQNFSNCPGPMRISSPGAFGSYPFIDYGKGLFGLIALEQKRLGAQSFGVEIYDEIEAEVMDWARPSCQ